MEHSLCHRRQYSVCHYDIAQRNVTPVDSVVYEQELVKENIFCAWCQFHQANSMAILKALKQNIARRCEKIKQICFNALKIAMELHNC